MRFFNFVSISFALVSVANLIGCKETSNESKNNKKKMKIENIEELLNNKKLLLKTFTPLPKVSNIQPKRHLNSQPQQIFLSLLIPKALKASPTLQSQSPQTKLFSTIRNLLTVHLCRLKPVESLSSKQERTQRRTTLQHCSSIRKHLLMLHCGL